MAASKTWGFLKALLLLAGAAVVLLFVTSFVLFLSYGRGAVVPSGATLVVRLGGDPPEVAPNNVLNYIRGGNALTVRTITSALAQAKTDGRIERVLLEPTGFSSPYWGKVQELRDAVVDFRSSGKPVYAYLEYASEREYYLATAADKVYLMPTSMLDTTGIATYSLFLRGTLDKAGVYPDLHHVGRYKTAVNQFTETGYTDAHREMDRSINQDLFDEFVRVVADARRKDDQSVRDLIDRAPFLPDDAVEAGLVDGVAYEDEVQDVLQQASGANGTARVDLEDYASTLAVPSPLSFSRRPRVAVIYVSGEITGGESGFDPMNGPTIGSDTLIRYIRDARRDDRVKAIVLRVDSPGGSATASDAIWHALVQARDNTPQLPLVTSMGDLAASGGYYVAMAANAIVSQPSTLTGSIGIFGGKYVIEGTLSKVGANVDGIAVGRHAGMNSSARRYTPEEVEILDAQLGAFYEQFIEKAAMSRRLTPEQIDAVGQGRVWTGRQALDRGLVDELGGLPRAIALAKERAHLGDDVQIVVYPPRRSLFELVSEAMSGAGDAAASSLLTAQEREALRVMRGPLQLFRPGELLALMPLEFLGN